LTSPDAPPWGALDFVTFDPPAAGQQTAIQAPPADLCAALTRSVPPGFDLRSPDRLLELYQDKRPLSDPNSPQLLVEAPPSGLLLARFGATRQALDSMFTSAPAPIILVDMVVRGLHDGVVTTTVDLGERDESDPAGAVVVEIMKAARAVVASPDRLGEFMVAISWALPIAVGPGLTKCRSQVGEELVDVLVWRVAV
jgi:hypothetical protein